MNLRKLAGELHRRSLWQVLGVYLAASWVALQVVDTVVTTAHLPPWLPGVAFLLLVLGLPVVLATAFMQEGIGGRDGNPAAVDPPGRGSGPRARALLTWRNALLGGAGAFALWGVVATVLVFRGEAGAGGPGTGAGESRPSVAVLPFENMGSEENGYFTDGTHEDVITALYKIGGMKVISRTSVLGYREDRPPITQIAAELGVETVLEGSVRREGDRVRVTAQLIDGRDEGHLWAETFDRDVSDVFAIQRELAREIAVRLRTAPAPAADSALSRIPTRNAEAYELVLRARAGTLPSITGNVAAAHLLEDAVRLDPAYAEARAALSERRSAAFQRSSARRSSPIRSPVPAATSG